MKHFSSSSFCLDECKELVFADDPDGNALLDQFFGPSVFATFCVPGERVEVLFANNEQSDFLGYSCFHRNSGFSGDSGGMFARHGDLAREAGHMSEQRAVCITFFADVLGEVPVVGLSWCGQFGEGLPSVLFGGQHDLGRGASIFFSIVVFEFKVEKVFQVREAMAAVASEFRPSAARHCDAIQPIGVQWLYLVGGTGGVECLLVKVAVLDQRSAFQEIAQDIHDLGKGRGVFDHIFGNAVNTRVYILEVVFGVNIGAEGENRSIIAREGESDLADALLVCVGGFNVDGDKAGLLGKFDKVASWLRRWWRYLPVPEESAKNAHKIKLEVSFKQFSDNSTDCIESQISQPFARRSARLLGCRIGGAVRANAPNSSLLELGWRRSGVTRFFGGGLQFG